MKLSDAKLRKLKAGDRAYKLSDGNGLYIYVSTNGSKLWRLKYRFARKEKTLSCGRYPEIGIAQARQRAMEARTQYAFMFPGYHNYRKPISDNAVRMAIQKRLGFDSTAHGFRAVARTLLDEELGFRPDIIEHQLHHTVKDPNGRAYNRTTYLKQRIEMMQAWADFISGLDESV